MPKLWSETVESHRHEVREAILDAAADLVRGGGLLSVTMSQIAETAGIGRATLYKYFADVEEVLGAWHERHVAAHLAELAGIAARPEESAARLRLVLDAYAEISRRRHRHGGDALAAALHRGDQADDHQRQLRDLLSALIAEAAAAGRVRSDVPAVELADYCLSALAAAGAVDSPAARARLVEVVWAGLALPVGKD
ncbi:MAG: TetR/AcrR family transcriptional regulator [Actinomycetes bacterium]